MALIDWSDALSTGIPKFDEEHKVLIKMINDLYAAMMEGKGKTVISETLTNLAKYTQTHFKNEEEFMKKHNYADFAAHQKEHVSFIEKVSAFKNDYDSGKVTVSIEVMNFLKSWLAGHIKQVDKKYGVLADK
jgi:hemerythrin-like metal-binding protein